MRAYVLVAASFVVALCVFACLSVCFVVDFLLLSFSDTCLLSGNSGTRLFWPPSHSLVLCVSVCVLVCASTRPLPTGARNCCSAAPVLDHSSIPPLRSSSTPMPDTRSCRCGSRHPVRTYARPLLLDRFGPRPLSSTSSCARWLWDSQVGRSSSLWPKIVGFCSLTCICCCLLLLSSSLLLL